MLVEKTLAVIAAGAAIAAAAAVAVVAAAFALYQVLLPYLGPAGAAAVLAATFALLALIGAVVASRKADGRRRYGAHDAHAASDDAGLIGKVFEIAKEKPLLAAGLGIAAGVFALRNPAILTAVISAFMAGTTAPPPKR